MWRQFQWQRVQHGRPEDTGDQQAQAGRSIRVDTFRLFLVSSVNYNYIIHNIIMHNYWFFVIRYVRGVDGISFVVVIVSEDRSTF